MSRGKFIISNTAGNEKVGPLYTEIDSKTEAACGKTEVLTCTGRIYGGGNHWKNAQTTSFSNKEVATSLSSCHIMDGTVTVNMKTFNQL